MKTVVVIFAGRKSNLEVQRKYLDYAIDNKIIDEVHYWNYCRDHNDLIYLRTISNLKRTSRITDIGYTEIFTNIVDNSFKFETTASNDMHVKIVLENEDTYEIVLGGWGNRKSIIHKLNNNVSENLTEFENIVLDASTFVPFQIKVTSDSINVYKNDELIMSSPISNEEDNQVKQIFMKTGHDCIAELNYEEVKNKNYYMMDNNHIRFWHDIYNYYRADKYKNYTIFKCDDDIVFMDLNKFQKFIDYVNTTTYNVVFANIINNGVSAHIQQDRFGLIPENVGHFEYPHNGLCGSLWDCGHKCQALHEYFLDNYNKFLEYDYKDQVIPIDTRFSINFFGIKGTDWHLIADCGEDDEALITIVYRERNGLLNAFYSDFCVSHLSFGQQVGKFEKRDEVLQRYSKLFDTLFKK